MRIEGATIEDVREVAGALGIHLIEQASKHDDEVKVLIRPRVGSPRFRAMSLAGGVKNSLCMHGWYAFMAALLAARPAAVMKTFVNTWDYIIFQGSALAWTRQQIADRERYDTCDCTPEVIEEALRTPDERRGLDATAVH
jgi:hypothetical protein